MFVYSADTYCDSCGERIRAELAAQGFAPEDPSDEYSYDSDNFPKGPVPEESTDGPDHCASGVDCLEPLDLLDYGLELRDPLHGAESTHIGALLSDGLTDAGVEYLLEMLAPDEIHYTRGIGSGATHTRTLTPYQVALHRYWCEAFSDEIYSARVKRAESAGAEHGKAAASWYFDGNTDRATYARVLQGLDEGDPAILDSLPSSPLSGEWADEPTPRSVLDAIGVTEDEDDARDDYLSAYEDAFSQASQDEVERVARLQVSDV